MPEKQTVERARKAKRKGKSPSTQAGEFVREEMHHIREGKHGARSTKQAIAIGLSKARRAGVNLRPPEKGEISEETRRSAKHAYRAGQRHKPKASRRRSKATELALKREPRNGVKETLSDRRAPPAKAHTNRALGLSTPSGANQRPQRPFRRCSQSGSHSRATRIKSLFSVRPGARR